MNIYSDEDTIAAIATPIGVGGISVIRISGKNSFEISDRGFRGKAALAAVATHTAHFGTFVNPEEEVIDEVVATVFRSPKSYTTDDTVELSCHGGILVTRKILELVLKYGARMAEPGEFTKRAFLNGRIDLAQAEAIADLIHSGSELSRKTSLDQLEGRLSNEINDLRDKLTRICGLLELELDFSEEGLEFIDKSNIINEIGALISYLNELVGTYSFGRMYREGVKVVLAGKPNVGKSSLLNRLLNENRAIVTEIPGTTRDVIEENIEIDGVLFKLVDTAGIRKSLDPIEKEGIVRTQNQVEDADIVALIIDPTQGFSSEDTEIIRSAQGSQKVSQAMLLIENKKDTGKSILDSIAADVLPGGRRLRVSAKTGEGLDELRACLKDIALLASRGVSDRSVLISNSRHKDSLAKAVISLELALEGLKQGRSNDLIAIDLRAALAHLGEITGEITSDDVLNSIFSKFCIGK